MHGYGHMDDDSSVGMEIYRSLNVFSLGFRVRRFGECSLDGLYILGRGCTGQSRND